MPVRVSATDRIRAKIDELFTEEREVPEILEEVARLGALAGGTMTPVDTRLLQDLRRSLLGPPRELRPSSTRSGDTDEADPVSATE